MCLFIPLPLPGVCDITWKEDNLQESILSPMWVLGTKPKSLNLSHLTEQQLQKQKTWNKIWLFNEPLQNLMLYNIYFSQFQVLDKWFLLEFIWDLGQTDHKQLQILDIFYYEGKIYI